jgi:thiol:disulfide interchange protein DsbC
MKKIISVLALSVFFVAGHAGAADKGAVDSSLSAAMSGGIEKARLEKFKAALQQKFPMTADATIHRAFPDFYSVVRGNEVLFVKEDLSILINGDVMDLRGNQSLTMALRNAVRPKIDVKELNLADAIKFGAGRDVLYVFSDPDCTFCRQLETEIEQVKDVTVYVFPFPIAGLHPNAALVAESIWCAPDKATSWRDYLTKGQVPGPATCANPIERNIAAASKYKLLGTPAIVFSDGFVIPGKVPASVITAQIAASKKP